MNRIVIIGNGFDKAHGLKTGYNDFIDWYWQRLTKKVDSISSDFKDLASTRNKYVYDDGISVISIEEGTTFLGEKTPKMQNNTSNTYKTFIDNIISFHKENPEYAIGYVCENEFFQNISRQYTLKNWVDIENEYYNSLKSLLSIENSIIRNNAVKKLNAEFSFIKKLLKEYLEEVVSCSEIHKIQSIEQIFDSIIEIQDISRNKIHGIYDEMFEAMNKLQEVKVKYKDDLQQDPIYERLQDEVCRRRMFVWKNLDDEKIRNGLLKPIFTLILNFNYTHTVEKLYLKDIDPLRENVINIHGELDNPNNPMIFGYGDELDENYRKIEALNDNDFLENVKSINYLMTDNYDRLMNTLAVYSPFQVVILGHSCGNSDRTLLNAIFENENCVSVKPYYYQESVTKDNYSDLVRNISRNFNDKLHMRDVVVNKLKCNPLVPIDEK